MGASVPVVLVVVDRKCMSIFYVCLNDYVSKYLTKTQPCWRDQGSVTLRVPRRNELKVGDSDFDFLPHWGYFARLARRSKLYSAANLAHHYSVELKYDLASLESSQDFLETFQQNADHFLRQLSLYTEEIRNLDIWRETADEWAILAHNRNALEKLSIWITENLDALNAYDAAGKNPEAIANDVYQFVADAQFQSGVLESVALLGRKYEEICRLERLPVLDPSM